MLAWLFEIKNFIFFFNLLISYRCMHVNDWQTSSSNVSMYLVSCIKFNSFHAALFTLMQLLEICVGQCHALRKWNLKASKWQLLLIVSLLQDMAKLTMLSEYFLFSHCLNPDLCVTEHAFFQNFNIAITALSYTILTLIHCFRQQITRPFHF